MCFHGCGSSGIKQEVTPTGREQAEKMKISFSVSVIFVCSLGSPYPMGEGGCGIRLFVISIFSLMTRARKPNAGSWPNDPDTVSDSKCPGGEKVRMRASQGLLYLSVVTLRAAAIRLPPPVMCDCSYQSPKDVVPIGRNPWD